MGQMYRGGVHRFQKEGQPVPLGVEFPARGFEDQLVVLRANHAADRVLQYRPCEAIKALLAGHGGDPARLTEEVCSQFIERNPDFKDCHPALVRAVAEKFIETQH